MKKTSGGANRAKWGDNTSKMSKATTNFNTTMDKRAGSRASHYTKTSKPTILDKLLNVSHRSKSPNSSMTKGSQMKATASTKVVKLNIV